MNQRDDTAKRAGWRQSRAVRMLVIICVAAGGWLGLHDAKTPVAEAGSISPARPSQPDEAPKPITRIPSAPPMAALVARVVDDSGQAIAGATICVADPPGPSVRATCNWTSAQGRAALPPLPAATGEWVASADGYLPQTFRISAGSRPQINVIVLRRASSEPLFGIVRDVTGGVVPGALLVVRGSSVIVEVASSDDRGHFRLGTDLKPFELEVSADGYSLARRSVDGPVRRLDIALTPASTISGRVVSGDADTPVSGVVVTAMNTGGLPTTTRSATTGPGGEFRFEAMGAGIHELWVKSDEWYSDQVPVSVVIGEQVDSVVLTTTPAATLSGRVEIENAICHEGYLRLEGPIDTSIRVAEGEVHLPGVPLGEYAVTVGCAGALAKREALRVDREPLQRVWTLSPGLTVRGSVLRASGAPYPFRRVVVQPSGMPDSVLPSTACTSDASGHFICGGLLPGDYDCSLDGGADRIRVHLESGADQQVSISAPAEGTIRVNLAGQTIDRERIRIQGSNGVWIHASRDEGDGRIFEHLPLGTYGLSSGVASNAATAVQVRLVSDAQIVEVTARADETYAVAGRVVDPMRVPIPDAWVQLVDVSPGAAPVMSTPVLTDSEGQFVFEGLVDGFYGLSALGPWGERVDTRVAAGAADVEVQLSGPAP